MAPGMALVAAIAAGGAVAAAQAAVITPQATPDPESGASLAAALLPVADTREAAVLGIGGNLPPVDPLALGALDTTAQVDVENLTKAAAIGEELARNAALIDAARADGADQVSLMGDTAYVKPTEGRLTSAAGARWGTTHYGLDIANVIGTPIYAFAEGVVVESGPASGFGLWVVIQHPDGSRTLYGHINRTLVEVGQRVEAGQLIAEVGNRGRSTGPHLHFEVWDSDGTKLDPMAWLRDRGIDL